MQIGTVACYADSKQYMLSANNAASLFFQYSSTAVNFWCYPLCE